MKLKLHKIAVALFITTVLTSCGADIFNRVNGNGNVITEKRKINTDFTSVKVTSGIDLYITQGTKVSLTVEADENLQDLITTKVDNGQLKIYTEKNIWRSKARKVHLTITNIEELVATSGSDAYTENTLKATNFKISTTSGADAKISINATTVNSSATSGSDLIISGKTENHTSKATSGSSIKSYKLESKNTTARATSGADIDIYASEYLDAKATSGGDIDYKGNPKKMNTKTSSGGSISEH